MSQLETYKPAYRSLFRKVAYGTWWNAGDPSVYGLVELDMTEALAFIQKTKTEKNISLSPTHLVGKAIAICLKERPELNAILIRQSIHYRKNIDIFFQVNVESQNPGDKITKAELSGTTLRNLQDKSVAQIAEELKDKATRLREKNEGEIPKAQGILKIVPAFLMRRMLLITAFLNYDLNLPLYLFGVPKDPFGSVMITSVGSMGIDWGLAPLVPYSRVPLLLAVGQTQKQPAVVDDQLAIRPIMKIGVTFDHRFIDGVHAAAMLKTFKACFKEPDKYFGF